MAQDELSRNSLSAFAPQRLVDGDGEPVGPSMGTFARITGHGVQSVKEVDAWLAATDDGRRQMNNCYCQSRARRSHQFSRLPLADVEVPWRRLEVNSRRGGRIIKRLEAHEKHMRNTLKYLATYGRK